jgi:hypothetical protein
VWTVASRNAAAAAIVGFALSGCGAEHVSNPISPEQARAEVVDAARDIVTILHADVAEATFLYESCNDQGEPPFRGVVKLLLWIPGVARDQVVEPDAVIQPLTAHGWHTDPKLVSHSPVLTKDNIDTNVTVVHRPPPGETIGAHVVAKVDGQCRDTTDHRKDDPGLPVDVRNELQPS